MRERGACALPGVSVRLDLLDPLIHKAISKGFVEPEKGEFVLHGLRHGFDLGVDLDALKGKRWFSNYPSALQAREAMTVAQRKRVEAHKTVPLCAVGRQSTDLLPWAACRVFPLGAVPKPLEPDVMRPVSDHSRSGLNEATNMAGFRHTLDTYNEIARFLKSGYVMRMSDVDGAFPLLPLAPRLWPFFLSYWYTVAVGEGVNLDEMWLYAHVCGDFGAAGMPGTWKVFFTDVLVGVARSESVLTLPLPVYVDDMALIGSCPVVVDAEGEALGDWLASMGVPTKAIKDKPAAQVQLALGFWWDAVQRTRTLEGKKLRAYLEMLRAFAKRKTLTLREMQQVGGRMQRAVMTLPKGSMCFVAALFELMRGLKLPWQKRRTTKAVRADFATVAKLLGLNLGKGYFCVEHLAEAPPVFTDASKESRYAGGGYFSVCGAARWWIYGSSTARSPIDALEGDAVLVAARDLASSWGRRRVPLFIDNRAFQLSAAKGWSKAERLLVQLRALFELAIEHQCVLEFNWISTHDNVLADALSRRGGIAAFHAGAAERYPDVHVRMHPAAGGVRQFGPAYPSDVAGDGPCLRLRGAGLWGDAAYFLHGLERERAVRAVETEVAFAVQREARLVVLTSMARSVVRRYGPWQYLMRFTWTSLRREMGHRRRTGTNTVAWEDLYRGRVELEVIREEMAGWRRRRRRVEKSTLESYERWLAFSALVPQMLIHDVRRTEAQRLALSARTEAYQVVVAAVEEALAGAAWAEAMEEARLVAWWAVEGALADHSWAVEMRRELFEPYHGAVNATFGPVPPPEIEEAVDLEPPEVEGESSQGPSTLRLRGRGGHAQGRAQHQVLSVPYSRASVFVGVPTQRILQQLDDVLDHRLAASSYGAVRSALEHWRVVCARHKWGEVIVSDDPSRGGKVATFALYLVYETDLAGATIANYLWGLRSFMKYSRQLDPIMGVAEWADFQRGVLVVAWVATEPHRMVPLTAIKAALSAVDPEDFRQVQTAVLILILLFTYARTETPCPKTLDGFDLLQHLAVRDMRIVDRPALHTEARLKMIKQDRLMERTAARGEEDWVKIGEVDGVFSLLFWLKRFWRLLGRERGGEEPFFVHTDPAKRAALPLTYQAATKDFREALLRGNPDLDVYQYGLHGLRVTGYALTKRSLGVALAVAQGGWESAAHERYDGFEADQVLAIPGAILKALDEPEAQESLPVPPTVGAHVADSPPSVVEAAPPVVRALPPDGRVGVRSRVGSARRDVQPGLTMGNCVGREVLVPKVLVPGVPVGAREARDAPCVMRIVAAESKGMVRVRMAKATRLGDQVGERLVPLRQLKPAVLERM